MHLRLPPDLPSRAPVRLVAAEAPVLWSQALVFGVGFPTSGSRVRIFTSSLLVMPVAPPISGGEEMKHSAVEGISESDLPEPRELL